MGNYGSSAAKKHKDFETEGRGLFVYTRCMYFVFIYVFLYIYIYIYIYMRFLEHPNDLQYRHKLSQINVLV